MELSQVSGAVRDLWDFLWPPIVLLALLLLVAWFVGRTAVRQIAHAVAVRLSALNISAARARLDEWGLAKIVPLAVVFLAVFVLYVERVLVFGIGAAMPPTVTYTPDNLIARRMSDADLACLWSAYSDSVGLSQLPALAERQGKIRRSERENHWLQKSGTYVAGINAVKFFFLWTFVWFLLEVFRARQFVRPMLRGLAIGAALAIVGFVVLGMYLYAVEQTIYYDIGDLRAILPPSDQCKSDDGAAITLQPHQAERIARMREQGWWQIQVEPFRYGKWIVENVLNAGRGD